jgi:hypothetical protein
MAYAPHRSCNNALHAGMTDGAYKHYAPDRGGFVEGDTAGVRKLMFGLWHGFNEAATKWLPDGRPCTTPYYVDVAGTGPEGE